MKRKSDANACKQVWSKPTVARVAPVRETKGGFFPNTGKEAGVFYAMS